MPINIGGEKKAPLGDCPDCEKKGIISPLTRGIGGITRCSLATCDFVEDDKTDRTSARIEIAEQNILIGEKDRNGSRLGLGLLGRIKRSRGSDLDSDRVTRLMSDPEKDPMVDGRVRE